MSRQRGGVVAASVLLALVALGACRTLPREPFSQGEDALTRGDLALALSRFDAVAVTDSRYGEARLCAAALERRVRRHAEHMLRGLRLRAEWRDEEAVVEFKKALEVWPHSREAKDLCTATERRRTLLARLQGESETVTAILAGRDPTMPTRLAPAEQPSVDPAQLPAAPASEALEPPAPTATESQAATAAIGADLAQIEAHLAAGDLDRVLVDLLALLQRCPNDARVMSRVARLLQHRGLLHFGQGHVGQAVADLQRATELDPELRSARILFELMAKELSQPSR